MRPRQGNRASQQLTACLFLSRPVSVREVGEPQLDVVWHEKRGYSPDEIVDMFPGVTLADVYAALSYYFDNRQEIEDEFKKSD